MSQVKAHETKSQIGEFSGLGNRQRQDTLDALRNLQMKAQSLSDDEKAEILSEFNLVADN